LEKELSDVKASLGKVSADLESSAKLLAELTEASNNKVTSLEADIMKLKGELESSQASLKQQVDQLSSARKELASANQHAADRSAQCTRLEASLEKKSTEANALTASEQSLRYRHCYRAKQGHNCLALDLGRRGRCKTICFHRICRCSETFLIDFLLCAGRSCR